jgi:hypothetical protein
MEQLLLREAPSSGTPAPDSMELSILFVICGTFLIFEKEKFGLSCSL